MMLICLLTCGIIMIVICLITRDKQLSYLYYQMCKRTGQENNEDVEFLCGERRIAGFEFVENRQDNGLSP